MSVVRCNPNQRRMYEAMAVAVDDAIGAIGHALKARGMWERSLLVFASDNGGPNGAQASNLPLRGGKDTNLEGGIRTLAAVGGGFLPAALRGTTTSELMHLADWHTTLSHLAGGRSRNSPSHQLSFRCCGLQ